MRVRIGILRVGCLFALVACNELLENRKGVLQIDETSTTDPTQPASGGETATTPDGGSDAAAAGRADADTPDTGADAAPTCPPGPDGPTKSCAGVCVSTLDPTYGCAAADCSPCVVPGALPACHAGACAILACDPGRADCNADPVDGCEADLMSTESCGACSNPCPDYPQTIASCAGACVFECEPGWADCNGDVLDGCETNLVDDPASCGRCGRRCLFGTCNDGNCIPF